MVKIEKLWPRTSDKKIEYVGEIVDTSDQFYLKVDVNEVYWDGQLACTWHVPNVNSFAKSSIKVTYVK